MTGQGLSAFVLDGLTVDAREAVGGRRHAACPRERRFRSTPRGGSAEAICADGLLREPGQVDSCRSGEWRTPTEPPLESYASAIPQTAELTG